jgi:VanZ family protein
MGIEYCSWDIISDPAYVPLKFGVPVQIVEGLESHITIREGIINVFLQKKVKSLLSWVLVIIWMILIFNLSAQPAYDSDNLSKGITKSIEATVVKISLNKDSNYNIDRMNHLVRKNAHFFIYLVLVTLVLNSLRRTGFTGLRVFIIAFGICFSYAIIDEIHQLFVPGRGAQVKDVFIDSSGVIVGMFIFGVLMRLRTKQ